MSEKLDFIVMGASGVVGSSIVKELESMKYKVLCLTSENFKECCSKQLKTRYFVNANGNSYRFKANNDPFWDFEKSFLSLVKSLNYFQSDKYIFFSSIDVYSDKNNLDKNKEDSHIDINLLDYYAFHKLLAEKFLLKYHNNWLILRLGTVVSKSSRKGPFFDLKNNKLYLNRDSTLSVIDTENMLIAFFELIKLNKFNEIYNLTGTGNVELNSVIDKFNISINSNESSNKIPIYYNISNVKLKEIIDVPSSKDIVEQYFKI